MERHPPCGITAEGSGCDVHHGCRADHLPAPGPPQRLQQRFPGQRQARGHVQPARCGLCIKCFLTSLLVPQSGLLKPWTDSFPSCLLQAMQPCMNRTAPQRQEDIPELHPV